MTHRLKQAITRFGTLKVVVLGDVMLDVYEYCYTAQSKPIDSEKPGRRAYTAQALHRHPGGAGNVAANLAALDVTALLIGVTGADGHHLTLEQLCEQRAIDARLIRDPQRQTTLKNRLYLDEEYLLRRDDETTDPLSESVREMVLNEFRSELDGADAVILSDYAKGLFSEELAQTIIHLCVGRSLPVIVDFKPEHHALFRGATIIAPNAGEARALLPGASFTVQAELEQDVRRLYEQLACEKIVVTLGEHGICGYDGRHFFRLPANRVQVVDAVGCGDTVRAVLALGHAAGLSLEETAGLANEAAAIAVQKLGTATITREELLAGDR